MKANHTEAQTVKMKGFDESLARISKWASWATSKGIFGWTIWFLNLFDHPFTPLSSKGKAQPNVVARRHKPAIAPLAAVVPPQLRSPA